MSILTDLVPCISLILRPASKADLKRNGAERCVTEQLRQAIEMDRNIAAFMSHKQRGPLYRHDGRAWSVMQNSDWHPAIREAADVIVGAGVSVDVNMVLGEVMWDQYRHLHRFPSGDLVFSRMTGRLIAYRSDGTARADGIDFNWSDVDAATGEYMPAIANAQSPEHPVLDAVIPFCKGSFSQAALDDSAAKFAASLRAVADAAMSETTAPAAPARRRL